ncbi:MAG: Fic family protein [Patescibacteria group bacterium]
MGYTELLDNLLANTLALSRTARLGDTSADGRSGKPGSALSSENLKERVRLGAAAATGVLLAAKEHDLAYEDIAALLYPILTDGIAVQGMYRSVATGKAHYGLPPERIQDAMSRFFAELELRLSRRDEPVVVAAWIEYQIDTVIHPYQDACGRLGRALAASVLWNADHALPVYGSREEYYSAMNKDWASFLAYYRTCFRGGT